jgi:hypothetical protein
MCSRCIGTQDEGTCILQNLRFAAAKINKKKETPNGLKNGKKKKGRQQVTTCPNRLRSSRLRLERSGKRNLLETAAAAPSMSHVNFIFADYYHK